MRTSHKKIKQKMMEELKGDKRAELFSSQAYRAYLMDCTDNITSPYSRNVKVVTEYSSENETAAYTNGKTIYINTGSNFVCSFPSNELRNISIIGLLAHKIGHVLFTNFNLLKLYCKKLNSGMFYPKEPLPTSFVEALSLDEIKGYLNSDKDEDGRYIKALHTISKELLNILEDVAIEAQMSHIYPGEVRMGLLMNHQRIMEQSNTIKQMMEGDLKPVQIMMNLILQYARSGDISNPENYTGEYIDLLTACLGYIDESKFSDNVKDRYSAVNHILLILCYSLL